VEAHSFATSVSSKEAVITAKVPLSHFGLDAALEGIVPDEYSAAAKQRAIQVTPSSRLLTK
jgi:hypothetical protein